MPRPLVNFDMTMLLFPEPLINRAALQQGTVRGEIDGFALL